METVIEFSNLVDALVKLTDNLTPETLNENKEEIQEILDRLSEINSEFDINSEETEELYDI